MMMGRATGTRLRAAMKMRLRAAYVISPMLVAVHAILLTPFARRRQRHALLLLPRWRQCRGAYAIMRHLRSATPRAPARLRTAMLLSPRALPQLYAVP